MTLRRPDGARRRRRWGLPRRRGEALPRHRGERGDRGEVAEIVLVLPVLMGMLLLVLQLVLWALAAHALTLAVTEGDAVATAAGGDAQQAAGLARDDVRAVAGSLVGSLEVVVRRLPAGVVSVSASGTVVQLLPGIRLRVSARSLGPEQGFRASG